jgi:predicted GIY-YIG superfamily endonuclease
MQDAARNYNENDILCKYGYTDDLEKKCSEHDKKYNKEFNTKIELLYFSIIESKYIFEAESSITQYFKSNLIGKHNNELKDKDIQILEYKIKLLEL